MKRILILDPDQTFAAELAQTIQAAGEYAVTATATVREACLVLAQQPQDLAFVPEVDSDGGPIPALRILQPDLRLVVMPLTGDFVVPTELRGLIQGLLIKPLLHADLRTVLDDAFRYPFRPDYLAARPSNGARTALLNTNVADILPILKGVTPDEAIQAVIFAYGEHVLVQSGNLNRRQAAAVALLVSGKLTAAPGFTQIQFIHFPGQPGELILFARTLIQGYHFILVATPETRLPVLRQQAEELAAELGRQISGDQGVPEVVTAPQVGSLPANIEVPVAVEEPRRTFALLWRPVDRLPHSLLIPVRRSLERLAESNDCELQYLALQPEFVHLVVTCPPGRGSGWAAQLFKSGSQREIQTQFKVAAVLWQRGHYGVESSEPLSAPEMELFLAH